MSMEAFGETSIGEQDSALSESKYIKNIYIYT